MKNPKNKPKIYRTCIATGKIFEQKELLRIVFINKEEFKIDFNYNLNGRGAYIQKDHNLIKIIFKKKLLHKTFRTNVPIAFYEQLRKELSQYDQKRQTEK